MQNFTIHWLFYGATALYLLAAALVFLKKPRLSLAGLLAGFTVHTAYMVSRGWIGGTFVPNGITDSVYLLPWGIAAVLITLYMVQKRDDILYGLVLLSLFTLFAVYYPDGMIPPTPRKLTLWAQAFFFSEILAHALFYCAGFFGLLSIMKKERWEFNITTMLVWGFVFYSIAQVTGAVWCYKGWSALFKWSPRHMQSATIWLLYANFVHLKYIPGWTARKKAFYAVAAAVVVLVFTMGSYLHEMSFPRIGG